MCDVPTAMLVICVDVVRFLYGQAVRPVSFIIATLQREAHCLGTQLCPQATHKRFSH